MRLEDVINSKIKSILEICKESIMDDWAKAWRESIVKEKNAQTENERDTINCLRNENINKSAFNRLHDKYKFTFTCNYNMPIEIKIAQYFLMAAGNAWAEEKDRDARRLMMSYLSRINTIIEKKYVAWTYDFRNYIRQIEDTRVPGEIAEAWDKADNVICYNTPECTCKRCMKAVPAEA